MKKIKAYKIKNVLLTLINKMMPKKNNRITIIPLKNCEKDKYDIINFTSDTALSLINFWIKNPPDNYLEIVLTVYHSEQVDYYKQYTSKCKNIDFKFITSYNNLKGLRKFYSLLTGMFRSKIWIFEGIWQIKPYSVKEQHQFVLGYFASCKSNYIFDTNISSVYRKFCTPDRVTVFSTSHFDSMAKSAAFGVPMKCFLPYGMARNDYLYSNIHDEKVMKWLKSIKNNDETKIILYAPTFRDYESLANICNVSIWGIEYDDNSINCFLHKNNIAVIAKLHPLQNERVIASSNNSIILYQPNFDFSFYELMKFADAFITDYSSIGYDWLFMDKPIIYNLWDLERYRKERGLAYEPYEKVCGGEIVTNTEELLSAINVALKEDIYADKRRKIKDLMFTVQDFSSAQKVTDIIVTYLEREETKDDKNY